IHLTLYMRLRPPALDRPGWLQPRDRASGSAPGSLCGCDLRPSTAELTSPHCPGLRICARLERGQHLLGDPLERLPRELGRTAAAQWVQREHSVRAHVVDC